MWEHDGAVVSRTQDADGAWGPAVEIAAAGSVGAVDVAVAPDGDAAALYATIVNGVREVWVAERPAGAATWTSTVVDGFNGATLQSAAIALDDAGDLAAVWAHDASVDAPMTLRGVYRGAGAPFGAAATLSAAGVWAARADVAMAPTGAALAVWTDSRDTQVHATRHGRDAGWSHTAASPTPWTVGASPAYLSHLAMSSSGAVVVASVSLAGGENAPALHVADGDLTTFAPPVPLAPAGEEDDPVVAFDAGGDAVAVWRSSDYDASPAYAAVRARVWDTHGPALSGAVAPERATAGVAETFAVDAVDAWSDAAVWWELGDGATAEGGRVTHAYAALGTHAGRVVARDPAGNETARAFTVEVAAAAAPDPPVPGPPAPPEPPVTPERPVADVTPPAVANGALPKRLRARTVAAKGLTVRATIGEASRVSVAVALGGKVVAKGAAPAARPGTLSVRATVTAAGRKALRRVRRTTILRVRVTARDAAGNSVTRTRTARLAR